MQPEAAWDSTLLESAKSSLIFEIIEREKSIGDLVVQSLLGSFKDVGEDYNRSLVKNVNAVSVDDLRRIGKEYISKLFSADAKTAIVCHPDKTSDIAAAFEQYVFVSFVFRSYFYNVLFSRFGRSLTVQNSLEDSILGKC